MVKKNKLDYLGIILVFIGVFILPYPVRVEIVSIWSNRTFLYGICYITWIGVFLLWYSGRKDLFHKQEWIFALLPLISLAPLAYTILNRGQSVGFVVLYGSCCVLPLYLMFIRLNENIRVDLIKVFLILLDVCVVLTVIWAVIDTAFDKIILKQIAPLMKHNSDFMGFAYPELADADRFCSLWGHPVLVATIFNMFYVLNICYTESGNKGIIPDWLTCLVALTGVVCCGSKAGTAVVILITLLFFFKNGKLLWIAGITLVLAFVLGLSDNIITRFTTQTLTTGRASALKALLADDDFRFRFFTGYGDTGMAVEKGYNAAFEFPFIKFSFNYGILFATIVLGTSLAYVTYRLLQKKMIKVWLIWLLIFAEVNTASSFAEDRDNSMIFYIFTMILLNIALCYTEKMKEESAA